MLFEEAKSDAKRLKKYLTRYIFMKTELLIK